MSNETREAAAEETKLYELGYLFSPLLPETDVPSAVENSIKKIINEGEGQIAGEHNPRLVNLAFPIRKRLENKNQVFREAYFGAIRFKAAPAAIPEMTVKLKKQNDVIRFLLIALPKGGTEAPARRTPGAAVTRTVEESKTVEDQAEAPAPTDSIKSKEAIDREIDDLLASTAQ